MNSCQLFGCLKTFFPKLWKSGPCSSSSSNLTCHFELNTIVRKLWNKADTWRLENGGCGRESELQRTDIQRGGASVAAAETEGEIFRMSLCLCLALEIEPCCWLEDIREVKWHQQCSKSLRMHAPKPHRIFGENHVVLILKWKFEFLKLSFSYILDIFIPHNFSLFWVRKHLKRQNSLHYILVNVDWKSLFSFTWIQFNTDTDSLAAVCIFESALTLIAGCSSQINLCPCSKSIFLLAHVPELLRSQKITAQ